MEWIATGVAVIAALVAGWQAWEARSARLDARSSATSAEEHESRTVAASERIAAAIEEQNARARAEQAERERYKNPWTMEAEYVQSGRRWRFHLGGDEPVSGVTVKYGDENDREQVSGTIPENGEMRPGQSFRLDWWRSLASPSQINAELHWTRPNGESHNAALTLD